MPDPLYVEVVAVKPGFKATDPPKAEVRIIVRLTKTQAIFHRMEEVVSNRTNIRIESLWLPKPARWMRHSGRAFSLHGYGWHLRGLPR